MPEFARKDRCVDSLGPTPVHDLAGDRVGELSGTAPMLFRDAPDHTRLRRLVARAFTPAVVRGFEARLPLTFASIAPSR
ncbi:hypothetical protein ACFROC_03880 [Nocardia tengchongensis]|uniref:hypothetical protein n=1 Tax=Nocardia tengchongensis TaxID=2055889 RepID=UPI0036B526BF